MPQHSIIAPSGAHRWMNCLGSAKMEARYPDVSNPFAEEGTNAHRLLEKCVINGWSADTYAGKEIMREDGLCYIPSEEMIENIQWCLDYINETSKGLQTEDITAETRYNLPFIHPELSGTCDVTIRQTLGELVIVDLKYGRGIEVHPKQNPQLMIYALGALGPRQDLPDYDSVRLVILQPRTGREPKEWVINPEDLWDWGYKTLKAKAERAAKGSRSFKAGNWCRFCKGAADCAKLKEQSMAIAGEVFGGPALPRATDLTPEQIGEILPKLDIFTIWEKAVRQRANEILLSGQDVPGFKVVEGRTRRSWLAEEDIVSALATVAPGHKGFFKTSVLTPAQLEKVIKKDFSGDKKNKLMEILNANLEAKEGKPTVVPESDKRPALNFDKAQDVFVDEDLLA